LYVGLAGPLREPRAPASPAPCHRLRIARCRGAPDRRRLPHLVGCPHRARLPRDTIQNLKSPD